MTFGGTDATTFNVVSDTQITATAPAHATGTVQVQVTTPGGPSADNAALDDFTYIAAPTVTGIDPISGSTGGGTPVTITGTDFNAVTAVTFGGTAATTSPSTPRLRSRPSLRPTRSAWFR